MGLVEAEAEVEVERDAVMGLDATEAIANEVERDTRLADCVSNGGR
jgi:hypothetical protein